MFKGEFNLNLNEIFTNPLRKITSSQIYPKITQKLTEHPTIQIHENSVEFLNCLKRERDISIKAMPSEGKMALR